MNGKDRDSHLAEQNPTALTFPFEKGRASQDGLRDLNKIGLTYTTNVFKLRFSK